MSKTKLRAGIYTASLIVLLCIQAFIIAQAYGSPAQPQSEIEGVTFKADGITYEVTLDTENNTACLNDIVNPESEVTVTVPSSFEHDGQTYTTTSLFWYTVWGSEDERANVTGLVLPDTVTNMDNVDLSKFPNLSEFTVPASVKVFSGKMQYMKKLETLTFSEGVEEIASNSMISGCSSLTQINLPSSLKKISAPAAFSNATALESIVLPEGIKITEGSLLSGCTSLKSIHLPSSLSEIPLSCFKGCTSLTSVTSDEAISSIGSSAFDGCTSLKTIPSLSEVTKIDSYAFNKCSALTGPIDLSSVSEMGSYAFSECKKLSGPLDLSKLDAIPSHAFTYAAGITSIAFSDTLTSIGNWAFVWANVSELSFPETLKTIGTYAFYSSDTLTGTVNLPDSITSVGNGAFQNTSVQIFNVGSGLEELNATSFQNDALKEMVFDNSEDNVSITGSFSDDVVLTFKQPSINDNVGDAISNEAGAPSLQEAVNESARSGNPVTIGKHVKLSKAVTVPAGEQVSITAADEFQITGTKANADLKNLLIIEEGASLKIEGNVQLSGRYNTGSVVLNRGTFELAENALVTASKPTSDSANGDSNHGLGIIDTQGEEASFIMSGGKIAGNALRGENMAYCGIVRIGNGAKISITGGEISGNSATAANALSCSSGVLLYENAEGTMTGGTISDNTGHRGSAVMLFGSDPDHRTTFSLSENGTIADNTCTSAGKIQGSGAVHVENNAQFTMSGGTISENKGVQGAGVCVVDGNLQTGQTEYSTGFLMEGGSIIGNTGGTGGGIYSYSNGVDLKSGTIADNTAYKMGGGIYSEGNYDHYSTLHLSNALITENDARLGGGMWFCATGTTLVNVTEGAALYGNTATDSATNKGAGDDFVFSGRAADNYAATLANRMLGGGSVAWYDDGAVYLPAAGVYPSTSDSTPRYGEEGASTEPVTVVDSKECHALKAIPLSEEAQNLAKSESSLFITGNKADMGGGIGANGGIVVGSEATTSVKVAKKWANDQVSDRPEYVTVNLQNNGTVIDSVKLNDANNWSYTFDDLPTTNKQGESFSYSVSEERVPGYSTQITGDAANGFTITNTKATNSDQHENLTPPNDSTSSDESSEEETPKTGDHSAMPIALAVLASCTAVAAIARYRKANR